MSILVPIMRLLRQNMSVRKTPSPLWHFRWTYCLPLCLFAGIPYIVGGLENSYLFLSCSVGPRIWIATATMVHVIKHYQLSYVWIHTLLPHYTSGSNNNNNNNIIIIVTMHILISFHFLFQSISVPARPLLTLQYFANLMEVWGGVQWSV